MSKAVKEQEQNEKPIEALILECKKDKYKLSYAAMRWAREIKQKENLPDPVPHLMVRALREILTGKVTIKDVEKLPMIKKAAAVAPAPEAAPAPTITLTTEGKDQKEKE